MLKKLFSFFAAALVVLGASAETVTLWESETSAGKLVDWGQPAYSLTADQAKATIKPGDIVVVTVASVTEGGWPQVTIGNQSGSYPPIVNAGVGGKQYPYVAEMGVFFPTTEKIYKSGFSVGGNGAYVSKVELRKCEVTLNANTIWYGPKQLAYGTALEINKSVFEEVKVGDKIQIFYDKTPAEHTLQLIFGGWGGANLPTYAAWQWSNFFTEDVDAGMYEIEMIKALENFTMEVDGADKTYNLFELLQNGGLIMQGPCLVNEVRFIPAPTEADPNAIWTGEKAMNWGDGVTLSKDFFQNVCPGDTLIVKCDNQSYQTL